MENNITTENVQNVYHLSPLKLDFCKPIIFLGPTGVGTSFLVPETNLYLKTKESPDDDIHIKR